MSRRTSIEAYNKIEADGLLSKRRWEVYKNLFHNGPATCRGVIKQISVGRPENVTITYSSYSSRFSELERLGVIAVVGETQDPETDMTVLLWDVTRDLPRKLSNDEKLPTRTELIRALADHLEEMSDHLAEQKNVPEKWRGWQERAEGLIRQCGKYRKMVH